MRSYYSHLQSVSSTPLMAMPVFRSSAIFPVFQDAEVSTRVLFLGYWFLKRQVKELALVVSLRARDGTAVWRHSSTFSEAKAYRLEVGEMLREIRHPEEESFEGSLELEFHSVTPLVYPFPAVVVNYYGRHFSTVVHTAQRVYNNYEDMQSNSETQVPEAGFNIYADEEKEPFIALINGPEPCADSTLVAECFNTKGNVLIISVPLGTLKAYETRYVWLDKEKSLRRFLDGGVGTVRAKFDVRWVFPRLLVGNRQKHPPAMVVTHTYYDCTAATASSNYWHSPREGWEWASLMVPLCAGKGERTKIYFYPIYSPCCFTVDLELYTAAGKLLSREKEIARIEIPGSKFQGINLTGYVRKLGGSPRNFLGARLVLRPEAGTVLPTRVKIAIDIGNDTGALPCNICTSFQPCNKAWEHKTTSFKWAPLLADRIDAEAWIMNSSPAVNYVAVAQITLTFYREQDTATITRTHEIPPNGCLVLRPAVDEELTTFFGGQIGWFTVVTSNPYTTTYYFSRPYEGPVGGDHGF